MSLRDSIERSDAARTQAVRDREEQRRSEGDRAQIFADQEEKRRQILLEQAEAYHDQFLYPIFSEVAAAKHLPMESHGWRLFGKRTDSAYGHHTELCYERDGRLFSANFRGDGPIVGVATGSLQWNYSRGEWGTSWNYLTIQVTNAGIVYAEFCPPGLSLAESDGYSKLTAAVEQLMVKHDGLTGHHHYPQREVGW